MTEMERILLEENRRLKNLLERVKMSRRKRFHVGHIRPVRASDNPKGGDTASDILKVVVMTSGGSTPGRPDRFPEQGRSESTATPPAGSRKAYAGRTPAGGTVH